jgi:hypothetical protein
MTSEKRMAVILERYNALEEECLNVISAYALIRGDRSGNHISRIDDWGGDRISASGDEYWPRGGHEQHYVSMPKRYLWEGLDEARAKQAVLDRQDAEKAHLKEMTEQAAEMRQFQALQAKYGEAQS